MRILFCILVSCVSLECCFGQANKLSDAMASIREFQEPIQLALIDQLHDRHRTRIWTDVSGRYARNARFKSCTFKTTDEGKATNEIQSVILYVAAQDQIKNVPFAKLSTDCRRRTYEILHFEEMIKEQGAVNQLLKRTYRLVELEPQVTDRMREVRQLRRQKIRVYLTGGSTKSGTLKSITTNSLKFGSSRSGGFGVRSSGGSNTINFSSIDRIRHRPEDIFYRSGRFMYASDLKKIDAYQEALEKVQSCINQSARAATILVKNSTNKTVTFTIKMYDPPLAEPIRTRMVWTIDPNSTSRLVVANGDKTNPLKTHLMEYAIKVGKKQQSWDWEFTPEYTRESATVEIDDAKLALLE